MQGANQNQTPVVSNLPSVLQQIQNATDKLNNDVDSDMKIGGRHTSKLFTPIQHNILAPAQKYLHIFLHTYLQSKSKNKKKLFFI